MKILIVEDSDHFAKALSRVLSDRGHEVTRVNNVLDGEVLLNDVKFSTDALVLDHDVLGRDGWLLRHIPPVGTRVVLMTGSAPEGSLDYYQKGDDISILIKMVEGS